MMHNKSALWYLLILLSSCGLWSCSTSKNPKRECDNRAIKILSYNVRNARGMDEVINYDRVADVIKRINPDCVAIQELDSATDRSKGIVVLDELAKRTGMYASYNKSIDYQGGGYGVGVLTKEKPLRKEAIALPGSEEPRSMLLVELADYIICSTHWSLRQPDRMVSADSITRWLKDRHTKPLFLAGDLNAIPGSEEIQKLSKHWILLNDTSQATVPVNNPKRCIDYLLMMRNPHFSVNILETKVAHETMASDHLPVWVSLSINKNN